jgi:hypothetical protein
LKDESIMVAKLARRASAFLQSARPEMEISRLLSRRLGNV